MLVNCINKVPFLLQSGTLFNPTLLSELPSLANNDFYFSLSSHKDYLSKVNVSLSLVGSQDRVISVSQCVYVCMCYVHVCAYV